MSLHHDVRLLRYDLSLHRSEERTLSIEREDPLTLVQWLDAEGSHRHNVQGRVAAKVGTFLQADEPTDQLGASDAAADKDEVEDAVTRRTLRSKQRPRVQHGQVEAVDDVEKVSLDHPL